MRLAWVARALSNVWLWMKLTLAFIGAYTVLLGVAGKVRGLLVARRLDTTTDDGLSSCAGDAAALMLGGEHGGRLPVPPADDEIGRLGRTLNEMLARLEAAFARERSFVADASHELRTPLAILRTELELALRGEHTASELEAAVRSAAEETERLSNLAEDLLVIARSDQGQLPIRRAAVHADDLLETVARRFVTR